MDDEPQKVPEARLGDNLVGRKDAHAIDFGSRFRLGGEMATDDLVFLDAHCYLLNQVSDHELQVGGPASSIQNDNNPSQDCPQCRGKGQ